MIKYIILLLCLISLSFSREIIPPWWKKIGPSNKNDLIPFYVVLKQNNINKLENILNDVSNPSSAKYGQY